MSIPALFPDLGRVLAAVLPPGGPRSPHAWQVLLPPGAGEVGAACSGPWLCLLARPSSPAAAAQELTLDLLRLQGRAAWGVKFAAYDGDTRALEARVELFVPEHGLSPAREQASVASLVAALGLLEGCEASEVAAGSGPVVPGRGGAEHLAAACAAAEWPCRVLPDGSVQVGLDPAGASGSALLQTEPEVSGGEVPSEGGGCFRATVNLLDLGMYDSPSSQRALAWCLGRLNGVVRGARASVVVQDGAEAVVLKAFGADAASSEEVSAVLGSLSVACQVAGAATDALADLELSRHYLAVMGGEPMEERNHNSNT